MFNCYLKLLSISQEFNKIFLLYFIEFPDDLMMVIAGEKLMHLTRKDNSFHYITMVGGAECDFPIKLHELTEWKEKNVDPVFYMKVC